MSGRSRNDTNQTAQPSESEILDEILQLSPPALSIDPGAAARSDSEALMDAHAEKIDKAIASKLTKNA